MGSNPFCVTIQILLICLVAEKVLENADFYNCVFGFNVRCGSVMCRIRNNITIAHKSAAHVPSAMSCIRLGIRFKAVNEITTK